MKGRAKVQKSPKRPFFPFFEHNRYYKNESGRRSESTDVQRTGFVRAVQKLRSSAGREVGTRNFSKSRPDACFRQNSFPLRFSHTRPIR